MCVLEDTPHKLSSSVSGGEEMGEIKEFRIYFLLNDQLKHPPNSLISGRHSREEAKAFPAFHPPFYYSFIPAMLIMVLRLVLDVLTKLLIWQRGRASL